MKRKLIEDMENSQIRSDLKEFRVGDTVRIHYRIIEGKTERIQVYEGICIAINGKGLKKNCTIRKISYGVGVERVFPLHSPKIGHVEVVRRGRVRRAKLYYLRNRTGKAARVRELLKSSSK